MTATASSRSWPRARAPSTDGVDPKELDLVGGSALKQLLDDLKQDPSATWTKERVQLAELTGEMKFPETACYPGVTLAAHAPAVVWN